MGRAEVELFRAQMLGASFDEVKEVLIREVPPGRWATPDEVAEAVAFLEGGLFPRRRHTSDPPGIPMARQTASRGAPIT